MMHFRKIVLPLFDCRQVVSLDQTSAKRPDAPLQNAVNPPSVYIQYMLGSVNLRNAWISTRSGMKTQARQAVQQNFDFASYGWR